MQIYLYLLCLFSFNESRPLIVGIGGGVAFAGERIEVRGSNTTFDQVLNAAT